MLVNEFYIAVIVVCGFGATDQIFNKPRQTDRSTEMTTGKSVHIYWFDLNTKETESKNDYNQQQKKKH